MADLLTKEHPITYQDVSQGSLWELGYNWMMRLVDQMLLKKYGILGSIGRFDSSSKCQCQDTEVELPFFDNLDISPVMPVILESSSLFHAYALHVHLKLRPHAG